MPLCSICGKVQPSAEISYGKCKDKKTCKLRTLKQQGE